MRCRQAAPFRAGTEELPLRTMRSPGNKSLKESQARAALLEKNLQDVKRLAQLKIETAALAQPPAAENAAASAGCQLRVKHPVAKRTAGAKPKVSAKPNRSLLDHLLANRFIWLAARQSCLVLVRCGFMLYRRKKKSL